MRPFLPEKEDNSSVCEEEHIAIAQSSTNVTNVLKVDEDVQVEDLTPIVDIDFPDIAWPFLIIAMVHILTAVGYLCLSRPLLELFC